MAVQQFIRSDTQSGDGDISVEPVTPDNVTQEQERRANRSSQGTDTAGGESTGRPASGTREPNQAIDQESIQRLRRIQARQKACPVRCNDERFCR
ncbi:MAG: hypothetical protein ABEI98_10385 [Halorhabdus sp.]